MAARTSFLARVGLGTLQMEGMNGRSSVRSAVRMCDVLIPGWKGIFSLVCSGRTVWDLDRVRVRSWGRDE